MHTKIKAPKVPGRFLGCDNHWVHANYRVSWFDYVSGKLESLDMPGEGGEPEKSTSFV